MKIGRNVVSPTHVANLCGSPFTTVDVIDVADELGLKRGYGLLERHEARKIISKLIVRNSDPLVAQRLQSAYQKLADESEEQALR